MVSMYPNSMRTDYSQHPFDTVSAVYSVHSVRAEVRIQVRKKSESHGI